MKDRSFQGVVFRFYYGSFSIIISYHKEKGRIFLNLQGLLTLSILFKFNINQQLFACTYAYSCSNLAAPSDNLLRIRILYNASELVLRPGSV